jgi:hypothetical protein
MSTLSLTIVQPVHNSVFNDADANVPLQANLSGSSVGLYFKWYSSLNSAATAEKPELNGDHSSAALNMTAPLQAFGSHVITLAAADQEGADMGSIAAITRSGMAGGAPPAAAAPCVIHRLKAQIRMPASNGQSLSRANSTLEVLAPQPLAKLDPTSGTWVRDQNYLQINGISMRLRLAPQGAADPALTAEIQLPLASTTFFRADDKTWLRRSGPLPGNLQNGNYVLSLIVSAGSKTATAARTVVLVN